MTKIITLYNNKGGVSKTTTLFNLAVYLVKRKGKKVLIADCDPQCNATELFFASNPTANDPNKNLPGTSIYEALKPRFSGAISKVNPKDVFLPESKLYKNLYLLRGDLQFSLAESYLAKASIQAITEDIHEKNTYVAISRLLKALGEKYKFDYILCDVGPSTGAITRMVVLSCDGFLLPLTPDRFCNQAVNVLGQILNEWIMKHQEVSKTFKPYNLDIFPGKPTFLGAIMQNFKIHSGTKAKASYQKWQTKIQTNIKSSLFNKDFPVNKNLNKQNPFIANIRDMGPIAPVAQIFGRAIFDVQKSDTEEASTTGQSYGGVVWQNWQERMGEYEEEIKKIAGVL